MVLRDQARQSTGLLASSETVLPRVIAKLEDAGEESVL